MAGIGSGVELEWSIVFHALVAAGVTPAAARKRNPKIQPYGKDIARQAEGAVDAIKAEYGAKARKILGTVKHSDELTMNLPPGVPEPKTDVAFTDGAKHIKCSVKMRGPIQLSSAEGRSTATMIERVVDSLALNGTAKGEIKGIIKDIRDTPTRLLSESNLSRVKKERPELMDEFLSGKSIRRDKNYSVWLKENKPALLGAFLNFLESHPAFKTALIGEAMSGELVFGKRSLASATHILTADKFAPITDSYIKSLSSKVKIDARAKSRGGITSVAFRFDVKA
jgi:hypothetical protein